MPHCLVEVLSVALETIVYLDLGAVGRLWVGCNELQQLVKECSTLGLSDEMFREVLSFMPRAANAAVAQNGWVLEFAWVTRRGGPPGCRHRGGAVSEC